MILWNSKTQTQLVLVPNDLKMDLQHKHVKPKCRFML